jgi:hypothetical protein
VARRDAGGRGGARRDGVAGPLVGRGAARGPVVVVDVALERPQRPGVARRDADRRGRAGRGGPADRRRRERRGAAGAAVDVRPPPWAMRGGLRGGLGRCPQIDY